MNKLYTIVRSDIPPGAQVAQTAHAVAAFASAHTERFKAWAEPEQRNIVCLVVPARAELEALLDRLLAAGVACAAFRETDLESELTGIACGEEAAKLLSSLPLAGRDPNRPTKAVPRGYMSVPFDP
jgi:hypothetical protein